MPLSPTSLGRFDPNLWSAYVRANMAFANKLVEVRHSVQALPAIGCTAVSWCMLVPVPAAAGHRPASAAFTVHAGCGRDVQTVLHAMVLALERGAAPIRV